MKKVHLGDIREVLDNLWCPHKLERYYNHAMRMTMIHHHGGLFNECQQFEVQDELFRTLDTEAELIAFEAYIKGWLREVCSESGGNV